MVEFFKKNFVLETAWFGSICSEITIIELSFEIEDIFSRKQRLLLGSIFLEKARLKSYKNLRFFTKEFCS